MKYDKYLCKYYWDSFKIKNRLGDNQLIEFQLYRNINIHKGEKKFCIKEEWHSDSKYLANHRTGCKNTQTYTI